MEHARTPLRPGMTALAAALAITATPLFAQAAEPAPAEAAPVLVSPPPPVLGVSAAQPTAPMAAPATVRTPTPTMEPIVHQPDPAELAAAERAERAAAARTVRTPARANSSVNSPVASTATAVPTATVAAPVATPAPEPVPATPPVTDPTPVAKAAPAPVAQHAAGATDDDILPIAGGVGAAILLLAGGAFALNRRRRDEDESLVVQDSEPGYVEARPEAMPDAPVVVPTATTHAPADTSLPSGFDISRFGRHTQAAYRGPTPENPSLSLKKRLKIASFHDGRERMAAEAMTKPAVAAPIAASPAQARHTDHITVRPGPLRPNFKPAFSS